MTYVIRTTVRGLEEKHETMRVEMVDGKAVSTIRSLGWFILLEDSREWRYLSDAAPPDLQKGDRVRVTIGREE